ncbi:MAG: zinc ribbon domain-containing protein [Candidatus Methanomethylophilaceae archaeon]
MYCPKCGKQLTDDVSFCSFCGANILADTPSPANNLNTMYIAPQKSTGIGIILAFLIPGSGHMYAGLITKGILIFIAFVIMVALGCMFLFPWIIAVVIWLWNIYDANSKINEYNSYVRKNGNPPW